MDELSRIYLRSAMLHSAYNRRAKDSESECVLPTLAHVPGVEIKGRYSTKVLRMRGRQAIEAPHGALKKPRETFASPRLVHLGRGKVMMR